MVMKDKQKILHKNSNKQQICYIFKTLSLHLLMVGFISANNTSS